MTLNRFMFHYNYDQSCPSDMNPARWAAMIKSVDTLLSEINLYPSLIQILPN